MCGNSEWQAHLWKLGMTELIIGLHLFQMVGGEDVLDQIAPQLQGQCVQNATLVAVSYVLKVTTTFVRRYLPVSWKSLVLAVILSFFVIY